METRSQQSSNQCGVVSLLSKDVQASDSQILFLLMTRFDNDSFSSVQSGTFLYATWNLRLRVATGWCFKNLLCRGDTQWHFSFGRHPTLNPLLTYHGKDNLLLPFFYGDLMMLFALLSGINTKQHKRSETTIDCSKKDS
jgi:hypothetical protein